jgi:DNA polymerase-3 subunit gamma/tau
MSQSLYRKWRPQGWDEVIGQEHVVQTLRNAVSADRVAHAYLFAGPRGTGKTTTARILAKAVNCLDKDLANRPCNQCEHCQAVNQGRFLDLIEIDAASNTSVDDVRDLRDRINFSPNQGRYKVYIIDEVHMLSTAAFNALLKTLEEPPAHAIFILATTEVHKIPATVLSRCQRHEFRRIPVKEIVENLQKLAVEEKIAVEPEALNLVARQATGSMRDAISLLDQLASAGDSITLRLAQDVMGTATNQAVLEVIEAMIKKQSKEGLEAIHRSLDAGSDPRQFARQIVEYLRSLLLAAMGNASQVDATPEVRSQMAHHAAALTVPELLRIIQAFNQAANEIRSSWQPALPLEIAFVEAISVDSRDNDNQSPLLTSAPPSSTTAAGGTESASLPADRAHSAGEKGDRNEGVKGIRDETPVSSKQSAEDKLSNQQLDHNWAEFLSQLKAENQSLNALVNSAKTRALKGNTLTLGMSGEVLKMRLEDPENIQTLEKVLKRVIGREIYVKVILTSASKTAPPAEVDNDGMVASALRDLGGEIVDIQ